MLLNLTQEQEQYLRDNFQLSYHIPYLDICLQKIPLKGLDVLEIGGALPASLVIDHLGCNSWTAVEAPSYDEELGEANQFHRNLVEKQRLLELGQRYRHYYCNAEDLGDDHLNQYDLIFSIACFEHINRLPLALEKMLHYLKPGGRLFTMHSPIWSAYDGHHLPIGIPERFDTQLPQHSYIFKPWGHLLQSRSQLFADIKSRFDGTFAEEVIYNTYNSNHINATSVKTIASYLATRASRWWNIRPPSHAIPLRNSSPRSNRDSLDTSSLATTASTPS
jgi:SAM-dependent methyltransferase